MGDILMINRKSLAMASGKTDSDVWPIAIADFSYNGIVELNRDLITDYGGTFIGSDNLRENCAGRLQYAIDMVLQDNSYLENDVYYRAAWIWERLVMSHLFHDGNKRAALASMLAYLERNHITIYLPDHMVDRIQHQMINKTVDLFAIARQLKKCR